MIRKISILFLLAFLPGFSAAEETRILAFSGQVEIRTARDGQWVPASDNAEVPEGGAIRTGADGSAVALMPNKTKVWLKESSSLELEQRQTLASRLALVFGKIKVRVPHLMRKEKFEVRTPAAVCAVRGTEFTVDTTETGAMNINVSYGEVKLNFVVPPEKGTSELYIAQGRNMTLEEKGKPGKIAMMTPEQEKSSLENWNPGLSPADRRKELKEKENDRAQMREFARVTNGTENSVKSFLNTVRESDIEAGRTLKDIHGNVVRVAQFLMRPKADEIQFVNLVKRPSYNAIADNTANGGFWYNGGSVGNRLDYLQMTMNFNQDLPQSIEDWPGFFNGNSVKPDWATFVAANRTKASEIFFIASLYQYDPVRDELINNSKVINAATYADRAVIVTGVLKDETGVTAATGLDRISKQQITDNSGVGTEGELKYKAGGNVNGAAGSDVVWAMAMEADNTAANGAAHNGAITTTYESKDGHNISNFSARAYLVGNDPNKGGVGNGEVLWLTNEAYVINNAGSLQKIDDLANSSLDPFSILKNVAGESIMSIKRSNDNYAARTKWVDDSSVYAAIKQDDRFAYNHAPNGTNIDVVFIPDLLVAAVQRMLPAITKLKD
jgi:hypothetical protein